SLLFDSPPTSEFYTLSLHDALPICVSRPDDGNAVFCGAKRAHRKQLVWHGRLIEPRFVRGVDHEPRASFHELAEEIGEDDLPARSEEHTSELQSRFDLVCRLLLEKK